MRGETRSLIWRYGLAMVSMVLATWIRLLFDPYLQDRVPFITFFIAVVWTAWYAGVWPGLFSVLLGGLAAAYFFIPPEAAWLPNEAAGWVSLTLFALVGTVLALLSAWMRRTTEQSRHERERFFVTLSSIGDGVIVTDTDARVRFLNAIAEQLTGWTQRQAEGQPVEAVFHIVHEQTRTQAENPVTTVLQQGRIVGLANHTILIAKDGTEYTIDDTAAPIRAPHDRLIGVVLVFRDVSAKRRAELEHSRLAALVESSEDAIIGQTLAGVVTDWNAGAERMYGYAAAAVVGKPLAATIVPPDRREELLQVLQRVKQGQPIEPFETIRQCQDGRRLAVSIRFSPMRNAQGKVVGASAIDRDMTQQKLADGRRNTRLAVTHILAQEEDVEHAMSRILEAICTALAWEIGCFWAVDTQAQVLRCQDIWPETAESLQEFAAVTRQLAFQPGEGLPGRVWQNRAPAWLADVTAAPNFSRAPYAKSGELYSGFACPITVHNDFFGVIEFFGREIQEPDADLLEMMATVGAQIGQCIERKHAEEQLRQSEQDLADFFEHAAVGLHWVGPDGIVLRVNQAELDLLGYAREEYVGHHIAEFHVDQDVIGDILGRLQAGETLHHYEARLRCKNGSIRYVLIDSNVQWQESTFIHTRCFTRDITHRKQAEEALLAAHREKDALLLSLRDSEAKFRLLSDSIPQLAWMARPDGHIFWYNKRWYEYTGTTPEEMEGWGWQSVHDPAELPRVLTSWKAALASGAPWEDTFPLRRHDGAMRWHLSRALPLQDDRGQVVQWFGTNTDITERKQIEATLQFLADASASLSALVDYKSTLQKVAYLAVPSFADWCAVDIVQANGSLQRVAAAHMNPVKAELAEKLYERHPLSPTEPHVVTRVLRTGASEMVSEITDASLARFASHPEHVQDIRHLGITSYICVPLAAHGRVLGALTFVIADSARQYNAGALKVAEDLAHRATIAIENARLYQEVREADRRKDEFLAMLAHELRNPLAPIRSGLDILAMETAGQNETIDLMQQQVHHLVRLVDDLLDVSRIMRGRVELRKEPVELSAVCGRALEAVRGAVDEQEQELVVSLPPAALWLYADPVRLVQVIENLLNNASKYTDPGGHITLTVEQQDGQVDIRVRDTGMGIEPDLLPKVFDLFSQSSRALDRAQGGLGIGLTLVRSLVEMHGGTVTAHSAGPGKGSEFIIRLPLDHAVPPVASVDTTSPIAESRRILVVDDNVGAARMLSLLLSKLAAHDIETVHDGTAALAKVEAFRPEIVFLDIGLPGLDGYQVAKTIRANPAFDSVQLVALTGYGQAEDRRKSQEAGFDTHLVKPPAVEDIQRLLAYPLPSGARRTPRPEPRQTTRTPVATLRATRSPSLQTAPSWATSRAGCDEPAHAFFAAWVHEVSNMAHLIRLLVDMLEEDPSADAASDARSMLEAQLPSMQALRDGLQRVRRAMGDLHLQTQPVDLRGVIDAAIQDIRAPLEARHLQLACDLPATPLLLQADPNVLAQACIELCQNALRYSDPGGCITISAAAEDTQVVLRVCNAGVGIAPDVLPRIFDLFVRGETSFDFAAGHFGAGLTLVRRIVEAHHGDVVAHSHGPELGSEFVVRLPRAATVSPR